jgi:hypothetical protein
LLGRAPGHSHRPDSHFVIRGARIPIPETYDREADAIVATAALQKQLSYCREALLT